MASSVPGDDFVAEINVTPFVDVMLVLLVIFMVTAPMMTEGLDVDLPRVETSEVLPTEDDHHILTVREDGTLFIDEHETGLDDLLDVTKTLVLDEDRQLFVRADTNVPYGVVLNVMDRLRGAGIRDVGLVTTSVFDQDDGPAAAVGTESTASPGDAGAAGAGHGTPGPGPSAGADAR